MSESNEVHLMADDYYFYNTVMNVKQNSNTPYCIFLFPFTDPWKLKASDNDSVSGSIFWKKYNFGEI